MALCSPVRTWSQSLPDTAPSGLPRLTGELFAEKNYKGDQYITPEWCNSTIVLTTGDTITGEKIRYNGYLDELIWLNTRNFNKFRIDKPSVAEFFISQNDSLPTHYRQVSVPKTGDKMQNIFLETAYEGKLSMYIYRHIKRNGVDQETDEGTNYEMEVLTPDHIYYFRLPSGEWIWMNKLKINNLLKYLPDQKKAIIQLIGKKHLKFKTENQCEQLVRLIDQEILTPVK
jgi:hypothetical protein